MSKKMRQSISWIGICLLIITISAFLARLIETGFGKVDVNTVHISDADGVILAAKLYRPVGATVSDKAPAVINIHGYQNDKLSDDSYSIELSRRGFVVIAPDVIGHGDSAGTINVGGVLMDPNYTGGVQDFYQYVKNLPYVDSDNIGAMGHSMGAIITERLGAINPEIKALNIQCGFAGNPELQNVLLTQARFDEFNIFREGELTVDDLQSNENRMKAFGVTEPLVWDTTFGDFSNGTARRVALIQMEHHFLPLQNKAVAEGVSWMSQALKGDSGTLSPTKQVFMWKEIFGLITLLTAIFMLLPLANLFLALPFFSTVIQPMPNRYVAGNKKWWIYATINTIIAGVTYPLTTQFGALSDTLHPIFPFLKLQVGNGIFLWLVINSFIGIISFLIWYRGAHRKENVTMYDMGLSFDKEKLKLDWSIIGKTILLAVILIGTLYVVEGFFEWCLGQEFRFVWPFMRQFPNPTKAALFVVYFIPALIFFMINGGVFLFGQIRQKELATPARTQFFWWLKTLYAFLAGLGVIWMIQYIPWFFFNAGPGFELLGLPQFSGLWPLMLLIYIPEFSILLFLHVWFYRRTGKIYLGAMIFASLMMWFLAAGSVVC